MFLLTEVIEVTEDGSGSRYRKSQSIFLIMYIHQRKTAELCKYFLFFRIYWCLLSVKSLAIKKKKKKNCFFFNGFCEIDSSACQPSPYFIYKLFAWKPRGFQNSYNISNHSHRGEVGMQPRNSLTNMNEKHS